MTSRAGTNFFYGIKALLISYLPEQQNWFGEVWNFLKGVVRFEKQTGYAERILDLEWWYSPVHQNTVS